MFFVTLTVLMLIFSIKLYAQKESNLQYLDSLAKAIAIIEENYVEQVDIKKLVYGAIQGMLTELDPHSSFLTPELYEEFKVETEGEFGGLGITIGIKNNLLTIIAPIEDTPAQKMGLKAGDIIIKIDDTPTSGLSLEEAVKKMRGDAGTKVTLTIFREGKEKPFDVTLTREIIKIKAVKSKAYDEIGYIRLTQFKNNSTQEVIDAIRNLRKNNTINGIILDLRNNPGGLLSEAIKVSSIFLPNGKTVVYTKDKNKTEQHYKTENTSYKILDMPLVVIVNEGSASASEIVAGALQDYKRAVILGYTTFGKASVQTIIPMPDNSAIKLTTALYYTPKGRSIQSIGIKPDVIVPEGKVIVDKSSPLFTEKNLEGHLIGENEAAQKLIGKDNQTTDDIYNDLQLNFALDLIKGLISYGSTKATAQQKI
jgi:carboxyl-terminal processing protease